MKLPVFKVSSTMAPADNIRNLGKRLFPRQDHKIVERGTKVELQSKAGKIEVDVGRGGIWASDNDRLWKVDPESQKTRNLLPGPAAENISMEILKSNSIMPDLSGPFRMRPAIKTGAITTFSEREGAPRKTVQEDTTILSDIEVDVSDFGLQQKSLPVVGGGGRFSVVLGEGGSLLATRGVWRPPVDRPKMYEVIPRSDAERKYRNLTESVPLAEYTTELAYYSAPAFSGQDRLYPVYVFSGIADYHGNKVPLRKTMIPATEIGPEESFQPPQPERKREEGPIIRPLPSDLELVPGRPLPPGIAVNRRMLRNANLRFNEVFVEGPSETPLILNPGLTLPMIKEISNAFGYYSAGTSWIGQSGGLPGSRNNAKGFVDELASIGWNIKFNWGDANAWESDWNRNDDNWVDSVDFVFYTGHASSSGWVLSKPDDTFLHFTETAGSPDIWGANNLEWVVVAACGPLQDELVGSGGNVLDRWRDAFDGMHLLMGYAQVTYDNEEEGKRLVRYAKDGSTIMQSWFRTAQEIQPSGIWAGAYYVGNSSGSTANDHLWGVGSVGPDISSPTWRACTWVPC